MTIKNRHLFLMVVILILVVGAGTLPFAAAHGSISGKLVYTADVASVSATELMFTISLGSNPEAGRTHIAGDTASSISFPQASSNGLMILYNVFQDTDNDGLIDQNTTPPAVGALKPDGTDLTLLTEADEGAAFNAQFSPDERFIVFSYVTEDTDGDGTLTIKDKAQLATRELGKVDPVNPTPRQLASNNRIRLLTNDEAFSVDRPTYLTNDLIVFTGVNPADGSTMVYVYDLLSEELTAVAPTGAQTRNPAVSKDGTQIAAVVITLTENYIGVYDIVTKSWTRVVETGLIDNSFAWSINGTLAIALSEVANWKILLNDGTGLRTLLESPQKITGLSFSPDGKAIAYLSDRDGSSHNVLSVATLDGGYNAPVTSLDSDVNYFDWLPAP